MCLDTNSNLFTLISQLDTFINGSADTKVHTQQGAILTLSGLVEKLGKMPLIQKVVDVPDLITARGQVGSDLLPFGAVARITNDPNPALNGLYEAKDTGDLEKIDYIEVCNLIQPNMLDKTFGSDDILTNPVVVFSRPIPVTNHQYLVGLDLVVEFVRQKPGEEGVALYDYKVLAQVAGDDTVTLQHSQSVGLSTIGAHAMPELRARVVSPSLGTRRFELFFEPFTDDVVNSPFILKTRTTINRETLL
ncbi:hypothetical protein [Delftia phage PhiW-14]|uniref:Uncharacterized protein n=1 Tax=Delftia phage PhiW-14 TaxID=665032 RepID=C9DGJ4_BPW14|nr:hypothetical protein DP-phiW-14_gp224 [Delftia phage PhiW-14]ACV50245.1 hypothetical protein [Delftia phage PhiW-14]